MKGRAVHLGWVWPYRPRPEGVGVACRERTLRHSRPQLPSLLPVTQQQERLRRSKEGEEEVGGGEGERRDG